MKLNKLEKLIIYTAILSPLFYSCSQPEGFGGNSHIKGVLIERFYNEDFSIMLSEQPAKDEDIYIQFADDVTADEKTTTSYTGNYQFQYLWPGNYKLYYYSEDTLSTTLGKKEKIKEITLIKNNTLNLDTLFVYSTLKYNEGTATIKGNIRVINYLNSSEYPNLEIKDIGPAQDIDIYLVYNNHNYTDDRIRTMGDGSFCFPNLIKGHYKIYLYSDYISGKSKTEMIIKAFEVDVTDANQTIDLKTITIDKL